MRGKFDDCCCTKTEGLCITVALAAENGDPCERCICTANPASQKIRTCSLRVNAGVKYQ